MRRLLIVACLVGCGTEEPPERDPADPAPVTTPTGSSEPAPAELCDNGIDDDGDGDADCDDDDCASVCDADGDGEVAVERGGLDCDDANPDVNHRALEVCNRIDDDCDGLVDDADPSVDDASLTDWYLDGDGDGVGAGLPVSRSCGQPLGRVALTDDCDDADPSVYPGAVEVCNEVDDDCDLLRDDADPGLDLTTASTFYEDTDRDGFGDPLVPVLACVQPAGFVVDATDCDDTSYFVNVPRTWWPDADGDGAGDPLAAPVVDCVAPVGHVLNGSDCDDADADAVPGAMWYADLDGDGFGAPRDRLVQCERPVGWLTDASDCDDADGARHPGATWYADLDRDGHGDPAAPVDACDLSVPSVALADDCDDADDLVHPGAPELCDGLDNDCDLAADEVVEHRTWYADADLDGAGDPAVTVSDCARPPGFVSRGDDCDDLDPELDGLDHDADGLSACDGDCDDLDPLVFPGAPELCGERLDCDASNDFRFGAETVLAAVDAAYLFRVADVDQDLDIDVLATSNDSIVWVPNLGDGTFGAPLTIGTGDGPSQIDVADLEGDGDPDVLVAYRRGYELVWHVNRGDGSFGRLVVENSFEPVQVVAADLDGDGDVDVIVTSEADVLWYESLGDGTFGAVRPVAESVYADARPEVGDYDGDGDLDVLIVERWDDIYWCENTDGLGSFSPGPLLGTANALYDTVDVGDFDGDGALDVMIADDPYLEESVDWYRNLGDGTYAAKATVADTPLTLFYSVLGQDLDGDGNPDVLLPSFLTSEVQWVENLGGGAFAPVQRIPVATGAPLHARAADLDGDGMMDVIATTKVTRAIVSFPGTCD